MKRCLKAPKQVASGTVSLLQSAPECVVEVDLVRGRKAVLAGEFLHRLDFGCGERFGLKVCQVPIGFARIRRERQAFAEGLHGVVASAGAAQGVTVALPYWRLLRCIAQQRLIELYRTAKLAD